jgi:hypothetical protein
VFDTASGKFNVVATLSTDVFMLLMALCGLFRMRLDGGLSGLARFLWTQVGLSSLSLDVFCDACFTNVTSLQGIIRIAICVLALLPASARFRFFLVSLIFAHRNFTSQVLIYLNLNGMFSFSLAR